jgi:quercetin dioxygenase-like cupin family protein
MEIVGGSGPDHPLGASAFLSSRPDEESHEVALFANPDFAHIAFKVCSLDQLRTLYARVVERDISIKFTANHHASFALYFDDPDGNMIEVYWPTGDLSRRQPQMEPLDLSQPDEALLEKITTKHAQAAAGAGSANGAATILKRNRVKFVPAGTGRTYKSPIDQIADRKSARLRHPDPNGPPDRRPIEVGEVWENPVTGEYAKLLELPWQNQQGRGVGELIALAGARVIGEHYHPALTERFTPLEGELTVKINGQVSILHQGETVVVEPGVWHDWWNATDRDIRVRVEVTPAERFLQMLETFYGLARLGHTDSKGMPHPLQLALCAREFSDVIVFRTPPRLVQHTIFGALGFIARLRGYRATYPQLSRIVLAPRT